MQSQVQHVTSDMFHVTHAPARKMGGRTIDNKACGNMRFLQDGGLVPGSSVSLYHARLIKVQDVPMTPAERGYEAALPQELS